MAMLVTTADITSWIPGDNLFDSRVTIPPGTPPGDYELELALIDPSSGQSKVKLAIAGIRPDGWYPMGKMRIE
jgi:hypothetical protein